MSQLTFARSRPTGWQFNRLFIGPSFGLSFGPRVNWKGQKCKLREFAQPLLSGARFLLLGFGSWLNRDKTWPENWPEILKSIELPPRILSVCWQWFVWGRSSLYSNYPFIRKRCFPDYHINLDINYFVSPTQASLCILSRPNIRLPIAVVNAHTWPQCTRNFPLNLIHIPCMSCVFLTSGEGIPHKVDRTVPKRSLWRCAKYWQDVSPRGKEHLSAFSSCYAAGKNPHFSQPL